MAHDFIDWLESRGEYFGGGTKDVTDEELAEEVVADEEEHATRTRRWQRVSETTGSIFYGNW